MTENQDKFLKLLFNEGEQICLAQTKYELECRPIDKINVDEGVLLCINPLKGTRCDENVAAFRTFLLEIDGMALFDQKTYIESSGVPFSACVFSGNKSLHYAIVLDEDIPAESTYRYIYQWILNTLVKADQVCKNPSRSIRFPDNARPDTCKIQKAVSIGSRVSLQDLYAWLSRHEYARPVIQERQVIPDTPMPELLPPWVIGKLTTGLDPSKSRNIQWFNIACQFRNAGFSPEDAEAFLSQYFVEEPDFKTREWQTCIVSGFKAPKELTQTTFR